MRNKSCSMWFCFLRSGLNPLHFCHNSSVTIVTCWCALVKSISLFCGGGVNCLENWALVSLCQIRRMVDAKNQPCLREFRQWSERVLSLCFRAGSWCSKYFTDAYQNQFQHINCQGKIVATNVRAQTGVKRLGLFWFSFALAHPAIGLENPRHPLDQSEAKLKTIAPQPPAFSLPLDSLLLVTLNSDWFLQTYSSALISH